ncbi:hypothetical protein SAMN05446935_8487 [Burkholderia sp. YR290]|nr:hypothetical protein SAMN05446935_8487 [Burkholderia sp. YR290]
MKRLGYARFASQGGDLGGIVSNVMARQAPPELLGIHTNFPATIPPEIVKALQAGDPTPANLADEERLAYGQLSALSRRRAYALEMGTRPQTLYGLADSPVGLASWLLDHPDGYGQPATALTSTVFGRTFNGRSAGALTRDDVLDDITLYWLTNTGVSAARFYWASQFNFYAAADVSVPAAVSAFPGENYQPRGAGRNGLTTTSSITTGPTRAATLRRGNSRCYLQTRFEQVSDRCAHSRPEKVPLPFYV